jgi:hypothetical protein
MNTYPDFNSSPAIPCAFISFLTDRKPPEVMKIFALLLAACLAMAAADEKDVAAVVKRVKASAEFQDAMNRLNEIVGDLVKAIVVEAMDEEETADGGKSGFFWDEKEVEFNELLPERLEAYRRAQQKDDKESHGEQRTTESSSKEPFATHDHNIPTAPDTGALGDMIEDRERPYVLLNPQGIGADHATNISDNDMGAGEKTEFTRRAHTKVAVLGCGPGGMFFLHAIATKRRKLQQAGDLEGLAALPEVTVYEKAPQPGGVWRETTAETLPGSVGMFGGLWTNSAAYNMEFFDFTLDKVSPSRNDNISISFRKF